MADLSTTDETAHPTASSWHLRFSLSGGALWGPAPAVMPDIAAYATLDLGGESLWSPALTVGALHAWRNDFAEPGGRASFALDAVSLDGCVLRLRWSPLTARACGSAMLGVVTSRGEDAPEATTAHRPFAAIGTSALVAIELGARLELAARLGTGWTLVRDSYEFGTTVFHRASRLTTTANLGLGIRFR